MTLSPEIEAMQRRLFKDIDRVIAALDGLSDDDAAWHPAGEGTSSILQLAAHVLGSAQNMVVRLSGEVFDRRRDAEFLAPGRAAELPRRAEAAKQKIAQAFAAIDPAHLGGEREPVSSAPLDGSRRVVPSAWTGGSGGRTARDFLLQQIAHTAEHAGHAEMTRDLIRARGK